MTLRHRRAVRPSNSSIKSGRRSPFGARSLRSPASKPNRRRPPPTSSSRSCGRTSPPRGMSASASCMRSLAKPFTSSGFTAPSAWRRRGCGSGNAPPASASSALVGWCTPLRDDRELDIGDEHREVDDAVGIGLQSGDFYVDPHPGYCRNAISNHLSVDSVEPSSVLAFIVSKNPAVPERAVIATWIISSCWPPARKRPVQR